MTAGLIYGSDTRYADWQDASFSGSSSASLISVVRGGFAGVLFPCTRRLDIRGETRSRTKKKRNAWAGVLKSATS